jgi:hypothetical protein
VCSSDLSRKKTKTIIPEPLITTAHQLGEFCCEVITSEVALTSRTPTTTIIKMVLKAQSNIVINLQNYDTVSLFMTMSIILCLRTGINYVKLVIFYLFTGCATKSQKHGLAHRFPQ